MKMLSRLCVVLLVVAWYLAIRQFVVIWYVLPILTNGRDLQDFDYMWAWMWSLPVSAMLGFMIVGVVTFLVGGRAS